MTKSDCFITVYRILSYLYTCFKAGETPNLVRISPKALNVNAGYWVGILECLSNNGYITGTCISCASHGQLNVKIKNLKIQQKGIAFLVENALNTSDAKV